MNKLNGCHIKLTGAMSYISKLSILVLSVLLFSIAIQSCNYANHTQQAKDYKKTHPNAFKRKPQLSLKDTIVVDSNGQKRTLRKAKFKAEQTKKKLAEANKNKALNQPVPPKDTTAHVGKFGKGPIVNQADTSKKDTSALVKKDSTIKKITPKPRIVRISKDSIDSEIVYSAVDSMIYDVKMVSPTLS